MITNSSSTVAVISDLSVRLKSAITASEAARDPDRLRRLRKVKAHADDLHERGLLKRQEYSSLTTADFEKRFCS